MPENRYSSEEALERAGHCELRKFVVDIVAADGGVAVAGTFVAIDPDA